MDELLIGFLNGGSDIDLNESSDYDDDYSDISISEDGGDIDY
jgi:hypothetical protein